MCVVPCAAPRRYFSMTGWRIGWCVLPTALIDAVRRNTPLPLPFLGDAQAAVQCRFPNQLTLTPSPDAGGVARPPQASALAQNLFISPPTVSQHAAAAAFGATDELEAHVARYRRNRAILLEQLPLAGFRHSAAPDGAFYVYADVSHLTDDSMALAKRILATTGVAVTPGIDFDKQARGSEGETICKAG